MEASVTQLREIQSLLNSFRTNSGLKVSNLFLLPNASSYLVEALGLDCSFLVTMDLGSYLGMPILHIRYLSTAGRVTLARSVLSSISVYTMGTGSWDDHKKMHMIACKDICKPKDHGGGGGVVGLRSMTDLNLALLRKLVTRYGAKTYRRSMSDKTQLLEIPRIFRRALSKGSSKSSYKEACGCLEIGRQLLSEGTSGSWSVHLQKLLWPRLPSMMLLGWWRLTGKRMRVGNGMNFPPPSNLSQVNHIRWGPTANGEFSVGSAYNLAHKVARPIWNDDGIFRAIWLLDVPKRIRFFIWMVVKGGVLINKERVRRHLCDNLACALCPTEEESLEHLFMRCPPARTTWLNIGGPTSTPRFLDAPFSSWVHSNVLTIRVQGLGNGIWVATFAYTLWWLWVWRNKRIFRNGPPVYNGAVFIHGNVREYRRAWECRKKHKHNHNHTKILIRWTAVEEDGTSLTRMERFKYHARLVHRGLSGLEWWLAGWICAQLTRLKSYALSKYLTNNYSNIVQVRVEIPREAVISSVKFLCD
ncbi:hypothetical protein V2J09_009649 [Rumex salicifolius]